MEAPKAPMGVGSGRGIPSSVRVGSGRGLCPLTRKKCVFSDRMALFDAF